MHNFNENSLEKLSQKDLKIPEPILKEKKKNPAIAVGLSALIPGVGHAYLGDMKTAGGLFGSAVLGTSVVYASSEKVQVPTLITMQNLSFYGVYATYRDVRAYNGIGGYSYKMPTDSLADLSYAPFQWSVLKKPTVWGGLLGTLAVGICTAYFVYPGEAKVSHSLSSEDAIFPLLALPVGIGEESFFRGFLQPMFSESFTPIGGIILSSLAFGAVHIPNAQVLDKEDRWRYYSFSLPLITGLGAYLGWVTQRSGSLKESVAIHTWYDLVIFSAAALATQAASTRCSRFAISVPF